MAFFFDFFLSFSKEDALSLFRDCSTTGLDRFILFMPIASSFIAGDAVFRWTSQVSIFSRFMS